MDRRTLVCAALGMAICFAVGGCATEGKAAASYRFPGASTGQVLAAFQQHVAKLSQGPHTGIVFCECHGTAHYVLASGTTRHDLLLAQVPEEHGGGFVLHAHDVVIAPFPIFGVSSEPSIQHCVADMSASMGIAAERMPTTRQRRLAAGEQLHQMRQHGKCIRLVDRKEVTQQDFLELHFQYEPKGWMPGR